MAKYRQTVETAIETATGELYHAYQLHHLSEPEFAALRRDTMTERVARKKGAAASRFVCLLCNVPLWLSRHNREGGNRWFMHDHASPGCPWYEGKKLSPDQLKAVIYRGKQEGAEHRRIKEFIASWLEREPGVTKVDRELVTMSAVLKGEWKRPDVQCMWGDKRIVFEIQLSYTFLTEVIRRDEFYRREGIFIIWVFRSFDLNRATVRDEVFFNHRNLFVLDETAERHTAVSNRLTFSGHFQKPYATSLAIKDTWDMRAVSFDDISFPVPSYRPFFFDYESARRQFEEEQLAVERKRHQEALQSAINDYVAAARTYYESDFDSKQKQPILDAANVIYGIHYAPKSIAMLSDKRFFGWHRVLPVLLSIKHDVAISYDVGTAYRVIEAATRQTFEDMEHCFTVLYLWAYSVFKPTVTEKQRIWVKNLANKVKESVDAGEQTYIRYTGFDEVIMLIFPELREKLSSSWAISNELQGTIRIVTGEGVQYL